MKLLQDRILIVTGVGAGLGRAYSLDLARHGARLVLNDVDPEGLAETERLIKDLGGEVYGSVGSVGDWDHALELVDTAVECFGGLHGVVNNAGVHYAVPIIDDTPQRMREIVEVNLLGTQFVGTAAIRRMVKSGNGGVILNVSSGAAGGAPLMASYSATKGAVASLTWSWAAELREHNIRVNAIDPSAYTAQVRRLEEVRPSVVKWGPEKIAPLVTYLMSELSAYVTGQVIRMWGDDLHLMSHHGPMPPWLSDPDWTIDKIDWVFRTELQSHFQSYRTTMLDYIPFPSDPTSIALD